MSYNKQCYQSTAVKLQNKTKNLYINYNKQKTFHSNNKKKMNKNNNLKNYATF